MPRSDQPITEPARTASMPLRSRVVGRAFACVCLLLTGPITPALARSPQSEGIEASPSAPIRLMRPDHVGLGVRDLDAMVEWYSTKLDFVVEQAWEVEGVDGVRFAYLVGQGWRVEMIELPSARSLPSPRDFGEMIGRFGYGHMAFAVEDVDQTMAALRARGVEEFISAESYPTNAKRRIAFIKDLEGNIIEIVNSIPSQ